MKIGGIDIGTTGCKLTVYNEKGEYIDNKYKEYNVSRKNGEHEIDASIIFNAVCEIIKQTAQAHPDLSAIGVTSFGETFVLLDENDNVLLPSMLYTDPRGKDEVNLLCERMGEDTIIKIAGVKPHQMYSLPKIMWIKNNLPQIYKKAKRIMLMEDYVVYMLSGTAQIDYSLAARTLGLDIRKKEWSREIFKAAEIDISLMSALVKAGTPAGTVRKELCDLLNVSKDLIIVNAAHDQVASAVGAGVFEVGQAVDGTGTVECITPVFDKIPTGKQLYEEGYSVVPYVFDGTYVCYALSFTGGAVLKWYRDNFAGLENEQAKNNGKNVYEILDSKVSNKPTELLILPHFAGAANPYMDNSSKAVIAGLTLEHTNYDVYKALMEGVTYEILVNIEHLSKFGINIEKLFATGGGASSPVWLQIKADILNKEIIPLDAKEVGACGTCMLTAVAIGLCKDLQNAKDIFVKERKSYFPNENNSMIYRNHFNAYKKIYGAMESITKEVSHK